MHRHEKKSTIMTSNRPTEDWGKLLQDVPTASALLDRGLHPAMIIPTTGQSDRLKEAETQRQKTKTSAA
jgi:DNA replication protein DnaC